MQAWHCSLVSKENKELDETKTKKIWSERWGCEIKHRPPTSAFMPSRHPQKATHPAVILFTMNHAELLSELWEQKISNRHDRNPLQHMKQQNLYANVLNIK